MNKIKFDYAENGEIEHRIGMTSFSNLFLIGAISLTSKMNYKTNQMEYPTDLEGLKIVQSQADDAVESLSDMIEMLGIILTNTDKTLLNDNHLNSCTWLIAGLGELIGMLSHENSDMSFALSQISETTIKQLREQVKNGGIS